MFGFHRRKEALVAETTGRGGRPPRSERRTARASRLRLGSREPAGARPAGLLPAEMLARVRRIEIQTKALVAEVFAGEYHSVFKGQGMEFAEVREYVPGDDIRSIDWNVTARFGVPFIKKFSEERELTVFFLVDASASLRFGSVRRSKMEHAAETCALLAFSAINNQDKVGLLITTDRDERLIPPRKGRSHGLRLVRDILYYEPEGRQTNLAAACETVVHVLRRRSTVFVLSDFLTAIEDLDRPLGALARKHDVIALNLKDPWEDHLPDVGLLPLEDLEDGSQALIDTSDRRCREELHSRFAGLREKATRMFRRHGMDQIDLTVGSDPVEPLMAFFRLRERRLGKR